MDTMTDVKRFAVAPTETGKLTRRDRARRTRLRMIEAAHRLFAERGYTGATMVDIAEAAGVAVQTLYFTFHTKAELLNACYDLAVLGDESPTPPQQQPWHLAMMAARSGPAALRHFAQGNSGIARRIGLLDDVVRSAAHEPDAAEVHARAEQLRRDGYRKVIEHLDHSFGLRPQLDPESATDLLLTFGGAGMYRSLVIDYGWNHERYVDWLADALAQQLLRPRR
jgi:AcrR family transcriptional regulator